MLPVSHTVCFASCSDDGTEHIIAFAQALGLVCVPLCNTSRLKESPRTPLWASLARARMIAALETMLTEISF